MSESDREFMNRRADQEMWLGAQSKERRVAAVHYELACRYLMQILPEDGTPHGPTVQLSPVQDI